MSVYVLHRQGPKSGNNSLPGQINGTKRLLLVFCFGTINTSKQTTRSAKMEPKLELDADDLLLVRKAKEAYEAWNDAEINHPDYDSIRKRWHDARSALVWRVICSAEHSGAI